MKLLRTLIILYAIAIAHLSIASGASLNPVNLTCEDRVDPLGIDIAAPNLSWQDAATSPQLFDLHQTAYQILVARTPEALQGDRGDVWDSGKVASDKSFHIAYHGQPLTSAQNVFWKVRVWDQTGAVCNWSQVAQWTTGILNPEAWNGARWITAPGADQDTVELKVPGSNQGYHSTSGPDQNKAEWVQIDLGGATPMTKLVLRPLTNEGIAGFAFPIRFRIEASDDAAFSNPEMIADQTGADIPNPGAKPVEYANLDIKARYIRVTATKLAHRGKNPDYAFALQKIEVFSGDKNVSLGRAVTSLDSIENFGWGRTALTQGAPDPEMAGKMARYLHPKYESMFLRREFTVKPGLKRALAFVCGLGNYELTVDGAKSGADFLTPGWTNYRKTCLYDTHDITALLKPGANAAGLFLGSGSFNVVKRGRYAKFTGSFGPVQAIALIRLEYQNGAVEEITSDENWKVAPGAVVLGNTYAGEDFDARLWQPGWNQAGFSAQGWESAIATPGPGGTLKGLSCAAWPLRVIETLKPVSRKKFSDTVTVFDFGQNASVIPSIQVSGPAGSSVKMVPAELTNGDGSIADHMCGEGSYCTYILAGRGLEEWSPRFYYRGARYFKVELVPDPLGHKLPDLKSINAEVVHSSAPPIGEFHCSNDLFNRIHTLVRWAQRSNMMSVFTDCPQREKLGWLEETHLNGPALRYEFSLNPAFSKIMSDMADSQTAQGLVPDIAPEYLVFGGGFRDSPEWGSALCLVAWQQYEFSGDDSLLSRYYEPMKRYMSYLGQKAHGDIIDYGLGDWYDIGPKPPGQAQLTPRALTATAFYYYDTWILSQAAHLAGNVADEQSYGSQAQQIAEAFNKKFLDPTTNQYATGSQCSNSIPLVMGLVPDDKRAAVFENLVQDVQEKGNTAGDVGYRYVLRALADGGRSDLIYSMNNQQDKPGYGMQLARGATSLTEAWDARWTSSQNHFMLGQINEWFYHDVLGIQADPRSPGFEKIIIRPAFLQELNNASGQYNSVHGLISSSWERKGSQINLGVTIPANTTATVFLPTRASQVTEPSGLAHPLGVQGQDCVFGIGSGSYQFRFSQ